MFGLKMTKDDLFENNNDNTLKKKWILKSESFFYQIFIIFLSLVMAYVVIGLPLKIAFFTRQQGQIWTLMDYGSSFIIIIDIILHFFLPYRQDAHMVTNKSKIAKKYSKSFLAWDILSIIPFSSFVSVKHSSIKGVLTSTKFIKLMTTIRQFKGTKYKHKFILWNKISKAFILNKPLKNFMNIMAITFLFTHIAACFWAFLLVGSDYHESWITL